MSEVAYTNPPCTLQFKSLLVCQNLRKNSLLLFYIFIMFNSIWKIFYVAFKFIRKEELTLVFHCLTIVTINNINLSVDCCRELMEHISLHGEPEVEDSYSAKEEDPTYTYSSEGEASVDLKFPLHI